MGAYAGGRSELMYLGCLMLLLPALAIAFARFRRVNLQVTRTFLPPVVEVGQPTTVELTVTNAVPLPTPELTWRDYRPWSSGGTEPGVLPPLAARRGPLAGARSSATLRYVLTPPRRGVFPIGPMTVEITDPFGLARSEVQVGSTEQLIVTPQIGALPENGLAILASDGTSMLVRRAVGGEDDLSTREYRTGDALRRVHWRATARHGELMVRQEEPRSHAEARVILDTRSVGYADYTPRRHPDEPESEFFELAISLASSIALHLVRSGFQAELIETGRPQLQPVAPRESFLRTLATIGLTEETGDYPAGSALRATSRLDRAHGSVFAILADADPATIDRLIAQRPFFDLAVAFVISWRESPQLLKLRAAGWLCVPLHLDDTVEDAWRSVADAQGVRLGR